MITYSGNVQRTFDWDCLNRLLDKKASGVVQASYNYRADGMRVGKYVASGNKTTVHRYDGQMGMEDVEMSPGTSTVTDYAIGARGVDGISTAVNGAASTVAYPLYDAHGNMIATLAKGGSNTYSVGNQRSYDAWGGIRIGNLIGDPKQQYCANLGHRADDETGFIYMRARYYEPSTARFLSEDPSYSGRNFYAFASDCPIELVDKSGRDDDLPSLGVGSTATASFAGIINNIFEFANVEARGLYYYINIQFAAVTGTGTLGIGATLAMLKEKALDGGFQGILMNFQLVEDGRFGPVAQRVVELIQRMGDNGELTKDGDFTQIYWLWGAM